MNFLSSLTSKFSLSIIFCMFLFLMAFQSKTASAAPIVNSPTPGSTLTQTTQTFNWSANGTTGIVQWWLWVGNTGTGSTNIYTGSQGTNTTATLSGLPNNGGTINFRLWYRITNWQFIDMTYTACNGCTPTVTTVEMVSPVNGSTLVQPSQLFTWQATIGSPSQYWMYVGTTGVGSTNIFAGSQGLNTQTIISGLPTNGSTIYVRLWYLDGSWKFEDYTYISCTACTLSPVITIQKESVILSDPLNSTNPKHIPDAIVEYTITVTNSGFGTVDPNTIVINDTIPSDTVYETGTLQFLPNTSGLTSATLNVSGGNIQVSPQGTFAATSTSGNPMFQVRFQVKIE